MQTLTPTVFPCYAPADRETAAAIAALLESVGDARVFLDEGEINMFAVMKELVRQRYPRLVYPEHPRALDYDRERAGFRSAYPGGGGYAAFAYNVGYARAMLQAALAG